MEVVAAWLDLPEGAAPATIHGAAEAIMNCSNADSGPAWRETSLAPNALQVVRQCATLLERHVGREPLTYNVTNSMVIEAAVLVVEICAQTVAGRAALLNPDILDGEFLSILVLPRVEDIMLDPIDVFGKFAVRHLLAVIGWLAHADDTTDSGCAHSSDLMMFAARCAASYVHSPEDEPPAMEAQRVCMFLGVKSPLTVRAQFTRVLLAALRDVCFTGAGSARLLDILVNVYCAEEEEVRCTGIDAIAAGLPVATTFAAHASTQHAFFWMTQNILCNVTAACTKEVRGSFSVNAPLLVRLMQRAADALSQHRTDTAVITVVQRVIMSLGVTARRVGHVLCDVAIEQGVAEGASKILTDPSATPHNQQAAVEILTTLCAHPGAGAALPTVATDAVRTCLGRYTVDRQPTEGLKVALGVLVIRLNACSSHAHVAASLAEVLEDLVV